MKSFLKACYFLMLCLTWPGAIQASMELVVRETFEGVRTLNGANPGNLGTWVSGAWHCRPVGPRLVDTAEPGWSGDAQGVITQFRWDLTQSPYSVARDGGMIGCWVRFEDLGAAGYYNDPLNGNPALVLQLTSGSDNAPFQSVGVTRDGQWLSRTLEGWKATSTVLEKTWYWVQIEWLSTPTHFYGKASYQPLGGVLTELSTQALEIVNYQARNAYVMNGPFRNVTHQRYTWRGRLGGATLAKVSVLGEGGQLPDLLPPLEERYTWYLNPVTGNDLNDGLSPDKAWKSVSKLNQESANAGMLSTLSGGYAQGDTLIIDTTIAELDLGREQMLVRTPDLTIKPPDGQSKIRIKADKDISGNSTLWVPYNTEMYPKVWMTTDQGASDLKDVVIWEDDRWLHHPTGPTISSVIESINDVPGSFYSDGSTLYLHPFESTNPNSDDKVYTRSRFRYFGGSAIKLLAPDLFVNGLDVRKTALVESNTQDPYTAYGIQGDEAFGGVTLLKDCYVSYGGKHCIGFTDSNSNRAVTVDSCQVEQGTPYSSQTPWVDYNGIATASGNSTTYLNCINNKPSGKIGSSEGNSLETQSHLCHNNGQGIQFSRLEFLGGVYGGHISAYGGVDKLILNGAVFGGGISAANETVVTRCKMNQLPISCVATHGILTARNNLCVFSEGIFNASFNSASLGKMIYEGNTFDLRYYVRSDNASFSLFDRVGPLNFTFRNNIFISPSDKNFSVLENALNTDMLLFSNNLYQIAPPEVVINKYNDGIVDVRTLSDLQALGNEQNSFNADPLLLPSYVPVLSSPVVRAGTDLGPMTDFSGRTYSSRRSIGALEPDEDSYTEWQARQFTETELVDSTISGAKADPDVDGYNNLFEFAFGNAPKAFESQRPVKAFYDTSNGNPALVLEVQRSIFSTELDFSAEVSSDLVTWVSGDEFITREEVRNNLTGAIVLRFRDTASTGQFKKRFMRIAVALAE